MGRKLFWCLALFLVASNLLSCEEANFDPDFGDPPPLPDLNAVQPEFDFFANAQGGTAFSSAAQFVQSEIEFFTGIGEFYSPFILAADTVEPERGFNYWEWNYVFTAEDATGIIRLAGEEQSEPVHLWSMFITVDIPDGPSVENYLFMQGEVHNQNQYGEWYIYDPVSSEDEEEAEKGDGEDNGADIRFSWNIESEQSYSSSFFIEEYGGEFVFEGTFSRMIDEYEFRVESSDGLYTVAVFWNTSTNEGYIDFGGERSCWNSTLQDISCEEIE